MADAWATRHFLARQEYVSGVLCNQVLEYIFGSVDYEQGWTPKSFFLQLDEPGDQVATACIRRLRESMWVENAFQITIERYILRLGEERSTKRRKGEAEANR